jgi:hypothetical protein
MASLKFAFLATSISRRRRRSSVWVSFQLTMKPSMPTDFAHAMCWRITAVSSLEYRPSCGRSIFARSQELGSNHW